MDYQCIIVGGGIAGLQAAIQLGRYMHRVLVIDSADGRSTLCHSYHNILGYPDGVSGQYLREIGKSHAEELGIEFLQDKVVSTKELDEGFQIVTTTGATFMTKRILLATGVMDRIPPLPELYPCLGISVYVCPDCDGGGNEVRSQLAKQLGVELLENKHMLVDPRSKMTNVQGVWAAGDIVAHAEQVTIAIGEGSQAGIWIHKDILRDLSIGTHPH